MARKAKARKGNILHCGLKLLQWEVNFNYAAADVMCISKKSIPFLAAIFHSEFLLQEIFEERNNNCITFSMPQSQRVIVGRAFGISAV